MPGLPLKPPLSDAIDIAVVAALIYALLTWMRGTRAHLPLLGVAILGAVYLLARQLGLALTASLFQGFFAVAVVVLVVIFQAELRQVFERIAVWGLRRRLGGADVDPLDEVNKILVDTAARLAAERRGALIVLCGRDPLERHLENGIALGGALSEPLLLSLFDPGSPGHDGAVVVDGDRVVQFSAHLPLSRDHEQLRLRGTRHAAALGLAERTDALCIAVSEERGQVSVAEQGRLIALPRAEALLPLLEEFRERVAGPRRPAADPAALLRRRWRQIALAVGAALLLWVLIVPGSEVSESALRVPVVIDGLPPEFALDKIDPAEVELTVSGLRRDLIFLDARDLTAHAEVDPALVAMGRRTFDISDESLNLPPGVTVRELWPPRVRLSLRRVEPAQPAEPPAPTPAPEPEP
jgi:uncharacterized protein (TIGR00159 family)